MDTTTARLLSYLAEHAFDAYALPTEEIRAAMPYTLDGHSGIEWETLPATMSAVRAFLGY